jgi:hypothetical protein
MATDETAPDNRYLTERNVLRLYKWLTVLGLAAVVVSVVAGQVVPNVITGSVVGCWLLMSVLLFAHFGTHNDPVS